MGDTGAGAILIVDDDPAVRASLALLLKQAGHASHAAATPAEAAAALRDRRVDLVLMDMNFSRATSGEEGLRLLAEVRAAAPAVPVILMTAWGSIDLAVKGMRAGASDFVTKPWTNPQLLAAVRTALGLAAAGAGRHGRERAPTRDVLDASARFAGIVGEDAALLRVLDLVARVAPTDASVLVTGESGTGKELVAEALHANGPRRGGPFVKVNLGGIPTSLFESEMFGHVRGAFTDARQDRKGRFETADGGTIFLDEVGDLDPLSQVKLLRVLQEKTYEVLGDSRPRAVDVRVVAATNRNLREMVAAGTFREDLLYRLNLITIELPPLRERVRDIPLLVRHFVADAARRYGRPALEVPGDALRVLEGLPWPGNVRQLRQVIERAALVSPRDVLTADDMRLGVAMERSDAGAAAEAALPAVGAMTLDELERAMILKSLQHHDGNVSERGRVARSVPRRALPPVREVRDRRLRPAPTLRRWFVVYLALVHLPFVALAAYLFRDNRPWLLAVEAALAASLTAGVILVRALLSRGEIASLSASFLRERDFGTRLNRTGQSDLDELVDVYNGMAEVLRIERVRQEERQYFLDRILDASPSGVVTLDFESRVSLVNPSAARMLGARPEDLRGRRLAELPSAFARELAALPPALVARPLALGEPAHQGPGGRVPRPRLARAIPRPRGAHGGAAEIREGRVREAHPDDVARGQQLARRRALAPRVLSHLRGPAPPGGSGGLRGRPRQSSSPGRSS